MMTEFGRDCPVRCPQFSTHLVSLPVSHILTSVGQSTEDSFFSPFVSQLGVSRTLARRRRSVAERREASLPSLFGQEIKKSFANGPSRSRFIPPSDLPKTNASYLSVP